MEKIKTHNPPKTNSTSLMDIFRFLVNTNNIFSKERKDIQYYRNKLIKKVIIQYSIRYKLKQELIVIFVVIFVLKEIIKGH